MAGRIEGVVGRVAGIPACIDGHGSYRVLAQASARVDRGKCPSWREVRAIRVDGDKSVIVGAVTAHAERHGHLHAGGPAVVAWEDVARALRTIEYVVSTSALKTIRAGASMELVQAGACIEPIGPGPAGHDRVAVAAINTIVPRATGEPIVIVFAATGLVACTKIE